jgi:uncharacterized lipoprotein YajG
MHPTFRFPRFLVAVTLVVTLFVMTGCIRNAAVYNVTNAPLATNANQRLDTDAVRDAILRAGNKLGWIMQAKADGHILGTLNLRAHQAVVDITHTASTFNIAYKDSANLRYDAAKNQIHKNYNGWIKNLEHEIQIELNALK